MGARGSGVYEQYLPVRMVAVRCCPGRVEPGEVGNPARIALVTFSLARSAWAEGCEALGCEALGCD